MDSSLYYSFTLYRSITELISNLKHLRTTLQLELKDFGIIPSKKSADGVKNVVAFVLLLEMLQIGISVLL